jgi:hypothetical protein
VKTEEELDAAVKVAITEKTDKCASQSKTAGVTSPLLVFAAAVVSYSAEQVIETTIWRCRLCFIEAVIHTDDCSRELLEWGSRVAAYNARPPNPQ